MATTTAAPWQASIVDDLDEHTLEHGIEGMTHAAVWVPVNLDNEDAELLGVTATEMEAIVIAEDLGAKRTAGEARVVKLADLAKWSTAHARGDKLPELDGPTIEPKRQNVEGEPDEIIEHPEEEGEPQPEDVDDDGTPLEPIVEQSGQTAIIDRSAYEREDLRIPKIDEQTIDRIAIKFTGEIHLDRSDASDVKVYNELRFGKDVSLLIEGRCNATGAKGATDREGDLDVVIGQKTVKIHSISKPAGADWVEA